MKNSLYLKNSIDKKEPGIIFGFFLFLLMNDNKSFNK